MAKRPAPTYEYQDFGISGLTRYGPVSRVYEEFLRELQGPQGMKNYREFMDNDPIAGAIMFACYNLARSVVFRFDACDSSTEAQAVADFVSGAIFDDMAETWPDTLTEIMSMLPFGWSLLEWRLKRRLGPTPPSGLAPTEQERTAAVAQLPNTGSSSVSGPAGIGTTVSDFAPSKFNDGRIGFRDWALRSQETLFMWEFDELSSATVMQQMAPPDYRLRRIPLAKALLFRTRLAKNNPEGYSILRNAWTSYYFKKKIQVFEAIGVERDLAGYPVIQLEPPTELMRTPDIFNTKDTSMVAMLATLKQMVKQIRRDEQEGAVMPPWAKLVLTSTGGARRMFDTNAIITRYDQRIGMSVLADFVMIGHDAVGSKGLASTKTSLFAQALTGFLDNICAVITRYAVPLLLSVNGIPLSLAPTMAHGDVETIDLADLGAYIKNLSGSGMSLFPDHDLEEALLQAAKLPTSGVADDPAQAGGYDPGGLESDAGPDESGADSSAQPQPGVPGSGQPAPGARPGGPAARPGGPSPAAGAGAVGRRLAARAGARSGALGARQTAVAMRTLEKRRAAFRSVLAARGRVHV